MSESHKAKAAKIAKAEEKRARKRAAIEAVVVSHRGSSTIAMAMKKSILS